MSDAQGSAGSGTTLAEVRKSGFRGVSRDMKCHACSVPLRRHGRDGRAEHWFVIPPLYMCADHGVPLEHNGDMWVCPIREHPREVASVEEIEASEDRAIIAASHHVVTLGNPEPPVVASPAEPQGTFACPICGVDTPHGHDSDTVRDWKNRPWLVRAARSSSDDAAFEEAIRERAVKKGREVNQVNVASPIGLFYWRCNSHHPQEWFHRPSTKYSDPITAALHVVWHAATEHALAVVREHAPPSVSVAPEGTAPSGCPCTLVTPCSSNCSCAEPELSGGCMRCAGYGSYEQRVAMAKLLAERLSVPVSVAPDERLRAKIADMRRMGGEAAMLDIGAVESLLGERDRITRMYVRMRDMTESERVAEVRAENELLRTSLQAETARLDWLEARVDGTGETLSFGGVCEWGIDVQSGGPRSKATRLGSGNNLREAIDAARSASPETTTP